MAINRIIDDIQSQKITQDGVNKATSGKKEKVGNNTDQRKTDSLEDKSVLSEDALKLQATEVILQTALQKLHEMDQINDTNFADIKEKIQDDFYSSDQVLEQVVNDIFTDEEIHSLVEKRQIAQKYITELHKLDEADTLGEEKVALVKERLASGYYDSDEIIDQVAGELVDLLDI
ncbi:MAG: hypothetical protein FWG20_02280 [Candidatus Cloacimonetes bacterium]|nr:hypothetical protein [Candidatus Cloacimonadota bacterium]